MAPGAAERLSPHHLPRMAFTDSPSAFVAPRASLVDGDPAGCRRRAAASSGFRVRRASASGSQRCSQAAGRGVTRLDGRSIRVSRADRRSCGTRPNGRFSASDALPASVDAIRERFYAPDMAGAWIPPVRGCRAAHALRGPRESYRG